MIVWTRMRNFNRGERSELVDPETNLEILDKLDRKSAQPQWIVRRLKFLLLTPFQDHWAPTMLMLVVVVNELLALLQFDLPVLLLWLFYVGLVGPIFLWMKVRRFVTTDRLTVGYKRIFFRESDYYFPDDDFLDS